MANPMRAFLILALLLSACGNPPADRQVGPGDPALDALLAVDGVEPLPDTLPPGPDTVDTVPPQDTLVCDDGICQAGEDCLTCPEDCGCPEGQLCSDGFCLTPCLPDCDGRACGPDGCGGLCGLCPEGASCEGGSCRGLADCQAVLGCVEACQGQLDACQCRQDAGFAAGLIFADLWSCVLSFALANGLEPEEAWGPALEGSCQGTLETCSTTCTPRCVGRACGPDGCGGSCGQCGEADLCVDGNCLLFCVPDCGPRTCGDNGCGGLCGLCPEGQDCLEGICQTDCVPQCQGLACGDDGCGGLCGQCQDHETCSEGLCLPDCMLTQSATWISQQPINLLQGYGSYLLAGGPGGVQILQKDLESHFSLVGTIPSPEPVQAVAAFFDFVYLASGKGGVLGFNIATPAAPATAFTIDIEANDLYLEDNLLVVASGAAGVLLLRVTDPYQPRVVSLVALPGADPALRLLPLKGAVGVVCGSGTLRMLDLTDNSNPALKGEVLLAPAPLATAVLGTRAFVVSGSGALWEADLGDLDAPVVAGPFGSGGLKGLALTKRWLFAAAGEGGVTVYDPRVPLAPDLVFNLPLAGADATAPMLFANDLLLGLESGGLLILEMLGCK